VGPFDFQHYCHCNGRGRVVIRARRRLLGSAKPAESGFHGLREQLRDPKNIVCGLLEGFCEIFINGCVFKLFAQV